MTDTPNKDKQNTMVREAENYLKECPDAHMGAVVVQDGREKIAMNSTAYVPLFRHPKVIEAMREKLSLYGVGAGSRYNMGHVKVVRELEEKIADISGAEECVLFQNGYNLNISIASPAFGENPYFITDQKIHPSILTGIRLSAAKNLGGHWGANCSRYITGDMENLEYFLKNNSDKENKWILSVGTYSLLGQRVNLPRVTELAHTYNAGTFLDDVHFFWVYGPNLCGLTDHYNIEVDILMASFKPFGIPGAFALGRKDVVSKLRFAEPYIFSLGLMPIICTAASAAIDILYSDEGREMVQRMWKNAEHLKSGLIETGFNPLSKDTQMVTVQIKGEDRAMQFINRTKEMGLIVHPYFHPAAPKGSGFTRLTPIGAHTDEHIDRTVEIMAEAGKEIGII